MVAVDLCEHCGDPLGPDAERWRRTIPGYETANFCADCSARLARRADDRAHTDDDEHRIRGMTASLAGEVWSSPRQLLWFRDPIVRRPARAPPTASAAAPASAPTAATTPATKRTPKPATKKTSGTKAPSRSRSSRSRR